MLSVSTIISYLYCSRKTYLQYVLGFREPPKKKTAQGTIIHQTADRMQANIREVLSKTTSETTKSSLSISYKKAYYLGLMNTLNANEGLIKALSLDKAELFKELWAQLQETAAEKTEYMYNLMQKYNVYGKELLDKIKESTEVWLSSESLGIRGVVDRIEEQNGKLTLYELKTGKPPQEGVWQNHKVQLATYMMIIKEKKNVEPEGVIEYGQDSRKINLNPFLEDEIKELIQTVKIMIETKIMPTEKASENKCKVCGLKKHCDLYS